MDADSFPSRAAASDDPVILLRQIGEGNTSSFERFYNRYSPLAYSLALRILRNTFESQDVLQEAFLQVWNKANGYNPSRGNPEAWLTTIVRSRAIDRIRSRRRKSRDMESLDALDGWENLFSFPEAGSELVLRYSLQNALTELPEEHRRILDLVYFEGYTQTEIAEKLNLPLGTAKTRIRASLKRLREILNVRDGKNL